MIPFYSDITKDHIMRTDHIVEHYLGSYENINPNHKENIIDITHPPLRDYARKLVTPPNPPF